MCNPINTASSLHVQCKERLSTSEGAQPKKLNELLRAFELAEVSKPGISGIVQRTTL